MTQVVFLWCTCSIKSRWISGTAWSSEPILSNLFSYFWFLKEISHLRYGMCHSSGSHWEEEQTATLETWALLKALPSWRCTGVHITPAVVQVRCFTCSVNTCRMDLTHFPKLDPNQCKFRRLKRSSFKSWVWMLKVKLFCMYVQPAEVTGWVVWEQKHIWSSWQVKCRSGDFHNHLFCFIFQEEKNFEMFKKFFCS